MDGLKSDSETELTSTMGNALSVTNKAEKNDTNDATPTSSTDASTASTSSRIVSDDPISSTSSDTLEQTKASEMNQSVTDLLENIPSEKITEDVEDLVHDLESLLGESTDSFSIPIRTPPEELKEAEDFVSQTSGELNVEQEEELAVTCDEEPHSEDTTSILDTSSICDASAEVSEELGLSGPSIKIEKDITSSRTRVEVVEKCNDANVGVMNDPPQTTSDNISSLENEIQPAQDTQEIQDSESEALSKVCDETENLAAIKTKDQVIDEANERMTDKGDEAHEPKFGIAFEAESALDSSNITCAKKDEHLEESEPTNEEESNAAAVDEVANQNIISMTGVEIGKDLDQEPENKTVDESPIGDTGEAEVENTGDKEIVVDPTSVESFEEITNKKEVTTESTCLLHEPQKTVEVNQAIVEDTNENIGQYVDQNSTISEDSAQSESWKNIEKIEHEGSISTKKPLSEFRIATVSEIPEVVSEVCDVSMSGSPETSEIAGSEAATNEAVPNEAVSNEAVSNEAVPNEAVPNEAVSNEAFPNESVPNEAIESMTEEFSSGIEQSPEHVSGDDGSFVSQPEKDADDIPGGGTPVSAANIGDIDTVSTNPNLSETNPKLSETNPNLSETNPNLSETNLNLSETNPNLSETNPNLSETNPNLSETNNSSNSETAECSVDINTERQCGDECQNMDFECAEPSSSSAVIDFAEGKTQPSLCTEQESEETVEVSNVRSLEEITHTEESIQEKTESNDLKESADETLEGISTTLAENKECSESNDCSQSLITEKCLEESDVQSTETDMLSTQTEREVEPVALDATESGIPQNEITEARQTDDNITQVRGNVDCDTAAEEKVDMIEINDQESESAQAEIISDESNREVHEPNKIEETATSILINEEGMEVDEENVDCQEMSNSTEGVESEMEVGDPKQKTADFVSDRPVIQEDEDIIEKPDNGSKQLAESSGIVDKQEKLSDNEEQAEQSNEVSMPLPIEKGSSLDVDDISCTDGQVEETEEHKIRQKIEACKIEDEIVAADPVETEEILTQPDSTQIIEKNIDDEKTTEEVLKGVVENEVEALESSEFPEVNLKKDDVQGTLETISDDESTSVESDKPTEASIDSCGKHLNITEGESKRPKIKQLEFAPLVLSEEDSEEEVAPIVSSEPKEENISPQKNIEENAENSEEFPQLEEVLADQPIYIESPAPSVDMQENLETILAVASLQKIDIPKVTEPELLLSEKERTEMEALRRAVESITDTSASAYVEEVEELINIPVLESNACDQDISSEQPELMEDITNQAETESISKSEHATTSLQKNEEIVPDEGSNLISLEDHPDTDETELVDSLVTGNGATEVVQEMDDAKNNVNFLHDIEQLSVDSNTSKIEQIVSTSMEIEAAPKAVDTGHGIDESSAQSVSSPEGKAAEIIDNLEEISSGPKGGDLNVDNIAPLEDKLETNVKEINSQGVDKAIPNIGESQDRETTQEEDDEKGTKIVSDVGESQERETTQEVDAIEHSETVPEVGQSHEGEAIQTMEGTETVFDVEDLQEREATQTGDIKDGTDTVPEVGVLQEREVTHTKYEKEDTKTISEVEESQKREHSQKIDDEEGTETDLEIGGSQRNATQVLEGTVTGSEVDESQKKEAAQITEGTETVSEVKVSQEKEATVTMDEKEVTKTILEDLPETDASQKVEEKKSPESIPVIEESQEREATQEIDAIEGTATVPEVGVSQEEEFIQTMEGTETNTQVEESQEREATQKVEQKGVTLNNPDNEECQEREVEEGNETDPDVGGSQEREATQKVDECKMPQRRTGLRNSLPEQETLIDSSQVISENEAIPLAPTREKEMRAKANERPKRHKKSDNKLEELSINVDVPDREKPYSPKITIKPIKVPDEEVSTTSNSESEVTKGSLKMTITKQSDKLHSVLKVCDSENPESTTDIEEPIPKLIIKPKMQQMEQQHSPKMSTRSSNQRSLSPRITIKPVVKPEKQEAVSPLKIKIGLKSEETPKKHSSKASARLISKQEEDTPRKVLIKPVVKPVEENEPIVSPRITIKPIPKPEVEELVSKQNIKAIRKQDEENDEKERSSPKITIKPVVKPQEIDSHLEEGEEVKERIVLKINKGNLPTPTKDLKKREHPPDDEKSEKLAKITVKFSKGGGHPHIVQQMEETHKRPHEEPNIPEKNKKQKLDTESAVSTRTRHKDVAVEALVETKSRHKEHAEGSDSKSKSKDIESPQLELSKPSKRKDLSQESPNESKRIKLKESVNDFPVRQSRRSSSRSRQKDIDNADDIQIVEPKLNSPIVISEDSRSQDSSSVILVENSKEELSLNLAAHGLDSAKGTPKSDSAVSTPSTTPTPKKRGRPRKIPIEVREEFKEQEELPVKSNPKQQEEEEPALQQPAQESGRPKRSCRGPSVCDRLGIKPRKPRGPGRGRGGNRGMGTRPVPMKPEKVPKLTKAKLKLMQKAAQDEAEAKKAFGKNAPDSAESSTNLAILEAEDVRAPATETKHKRKSKVDPAKPEQETENKLEVSEPEELKASETKKLIKSKVFKKLAIQKSAGDKRTSVDEKISAEVESRTDVGKDVSSVKKSPQEAHSSGNNPQKSTGVQITTTNSEKSSGGTEHKNDDSTETCTKTEQASLDTQQNPPDIKQEHPLVESLKSVQTEESDPVKTVVDIKQKSVLLKETLSLPDEQVSLELKKELLDSEDISLEVKAELILANETPDGVDVSSLTVEEVSFKLEDKDIEVEGKSIELCKDAVDVAVDVEDEIPYSILAPPGSASSKVFPGLAHGIPASVQPLIATSQKSSNLEHSSITSTSGPSEIDMVDEETRMSADTSSRAQTPAKQMVAPADMTIEESQSSVHSTATTESGKTPSSRPSKAPRLEVQESDNNIITAELISEYYWNGNGPFMLQEQVAQFLGIKSFKRKYPGIARRMVEMQERDFIREKGLASENMCDLGLTVVNSADILDIMYSDFQEKYEEYCKHQRDRQAKEMIDKQRAMNLAASQEKNKADITEQAKQSAAQWNAKFNKTRKDQRRTCMDLQTLTVHYPKGRIKQINKVTTGNYPVALVPGQFTDFYEEFTPTEINNLPLNTMCYDPVTFIPREESEDSASDGSESDSDSSDSSSSGSNSDSSSGVEDCKLCSKHSPKRVVTPK